jgi:hypothetical protein
MIPAKIGTAAACPSFISARWRSAARPSRRCAGGRRRGPRSARCRSSRAFRPKRADELVGGSIFWILQHRITARQTILGFAEQEADRRTIIRLDPELVPVRPFPQTRSPGMALPPGSDAPIDLGDGYDAADLPPPLLQALSALALI